MNDPQKTSIGWICPYCSASWPENLLRIVDTRRIYQVGYQPESGLMTQILDREPQRCQVYSCRSCEAQMKLQDEEILALLRQLNRKKCLEKTEQRFK